MNHIKKLLITGLLLIGSAEIFASGSITNNSSFAINLIMYGSNYNAPTAKFSATGRINPQGLIIPPGQNTSFLPGTTSVDVHADGKPALHAEINSTANYTINPGIPLWSITQDR